MQILLSSKRNQQGRQRGVIQKKSNFSTLDFNFVPCFLYPVSMQIEAFVEHMKPRIELDTFSDGRLMVRVRFCSNSNFWIQDMGKATWVPTLKEVDLLKEAIDAIDEYNQGKKINYLKQ